MMKETAPGYGQLETGLTRPHKKVVILITARAKIFIETADGLKDPAMDHETDTVRLVFALDIFHPGHKVSGIVRKIARQFTFAHGRAGDIHLILLGEGD